MVLSDVIRAIENLYNSELPPSFPGVLSDEIVWSSLHHDWKDERYWFSFEELQLFGAYMGPEVVVYCHYISAEGGAIRGVRSW